VEILTSSSNATPTRLNVGRRERVLRAQGAPGQRPPRALQEPVPRHLHVQDERAGARQAFRDAVTSEGGWTIKNDERVKYVGKLEVAKGDDQTLKVTMEDYPEAGMSALKYYTIQSYTK